MKRIWNLLLPVLLLLSLLTGCGSALPPSDGSSPSEPVPAIAEEQDALGDGQEAAAETITLDTIPAFSGEAYVAINDNQPFFTPEEYTTEAFETYSDLDELGRCGIAYANICQELMPTEPRGEIGQIKPTGWQTVKYDCVDGGYLYNRCHLIGFQLAGENANPLNLITGTRYLNISGMLPFENLVADYVQETDNHVLYRVTPMFTGDQLLADGVLMEGWSVEDEGEGVCFCVYAYNVQPGVSIDYATGESTPDESAAEIPAGEVLPEESVPETLPEEPLPEENSTGDTSGGNGGEDTTYVLNTNSMKFHLPDCSGAASISESNRQDFSGTREEVIAMGYDPCGICKP